MEDLTIKKDKKTIFDSQGSTIDPRGILDVIEVVMDNCLKSQDSHVISINVMSTPKTSSIQEDLGLAN